MSTTIPLELQSLLHNSAIVNEIWGPIESRDGGQVRLDALASFIQYFDTEKEFEQAHEDLIIGTIRSLKQRPDKPKSAFQSNFEATSSTSRNSPEVHILDLTVRCILPINRAPQQDLASFRMGKLSASYLGLFANVQIRWTDNLSDHLILLRGEGWKSLYLFRHPGFLHFSLDVLSNADEDTKQTPLEALKLGCLPPGLLKETLMTFDIIFPLIGDNASYHILQREVETNGLDKYLLDRFYHESREHDRLSDALDPRDVRSLYEKHPYWADRLYDLWREADDPTPTTRIERWTEARRNPRFTYWCAVVSIMIAISFGALATALATIQVWISWCSLIDDPTVAQCWYKKSPYAGKPSY
ncbi:hypothetical protein GGR57DRAFT_520596 [Xylariaceae sp. FL1272]|nr:hypothetical protein GGR57DRAFT_520596 [Xylariaceae sp. FL1272]